MPPQPNSRVFGMVRSPERTVLRLIAAGALVAGPLLLMIRGQVVATTATLATLAGVGAICVGIAALVYSFFAKEPPMSWVEVSQSELIRVFPRTPELRIPLTDVRRLFLRPTRVVTVSKRGVQREWARYELHVDGFAPPEVDPAPEHHEHALARGAVLCGALEPLRKVGAEIADACDASFDDAVAQPPSAAN